MCNGYHVEHFIGDESLQPQIVGEILRYTLDTAWTVMIYHEAFIPRSGVRIPDKLLSICPIEISPPPPTNIIDSFGHFIIISQKTVP